MCKKLKNCENIENIDMHKLIKPVKLAANNELDESFLNSQILNFDEIDKQDLPFIQTLVQKANKNTLLLYLIKEEISQHLVN